MNYYYYFLISTTTWWLTLTRADIPRFRGVSLSKATLYHPRNDLTWVCLDGSATIKFTRINDDYCDCEDGSDEPGTNACPNGIFHCSNVGYRSRDIPTSRVNDGVCDCCDASDEYKLVQEGAYCVNNCMELGRAEEEQRQHAIEIHKKGASKRADMIVKGKELLLDKEKHLQELESRKEELEILRDEKEGLMKQAETEESEALELFRELQREKMDTQDKQETAINDKLMRKEAHIFFHHYDINHDGYIDISELQLVMIIDRDRNGVVSLEEAKHFTDQRDHVDFEEFLSISWPQIKSIQRLTEEVLQSPSTDEIYYDHSENVDNSDNVSGTKNDENNEQENDEDEGAETYDNEEVFEDDNDGEDDSEIDTDTEVGVGTATKVDVPIVEYDAETQRIINMANEARNALADVERTLHEIDEQINQLKREIEKDYGSQNEYAMLQTECFKYEDREYVYTLCPFERASQQLRDSGSETTLGNWDKWLSYENNNYSYQKYSHGASCWNGPQRSTTVQLKCGLHSQLTGVSEPSRCEYFFVLETPAACDELILKANEERLRDEL